MDGASIIIRAKKKFGLSTDRALAEHFGTTLQTIRNWKRRKTITERQLLQLIDSAVRSASVRTKQTAIRPIMEFMRIDKSHSRQKKKYEILTVVGGKARENAYRKGLRGELERLKGVYVFFDSRGQAIYVGKAQKQSLWKELNLAFNRDRGEVQKIKRVKHPTSNVSFVTARERKRQIRPYLVPLHDIAHYVSAYEVADGMVGVLEAMLVRSFANDLLNVRMEKFTSARLPTGARARRN